MKILKAFVCVFLMSLSAGSIEASANEMMSTNSATIANLQEQSKVSSGKSSKKSSRKKSKKNKKVKEKEVKEKCISCKKTYSEKELKYVGERNGYMCRPCYVKWHNAQDVF